MTVEGALGATVGKGWHLGATKLPGCFGKHLESGEGFGGNSPNLWIVVRRQDL